jgi:hypothetical protein
MMLCTHTPLLVTWFPVSVSVFHCTACANSRSCTRWAIAHALQDIRKNRVSQIVGARCAPTDSRNLIFANSWRSPFGRGSRFALPHSSLFAVFVRASSATSLHDFLRALCVPPAGVRAYTACGHSASLCSYCCFLVRASMNSRFFSLFGGVFFCLRL